MSPTKIVDIEKKIGGLPVPIPAERRCQAKNRRGQQCECWAMRNKRVCRLHGGKNRGQSPEGRKRIAAAHMIHGRYSLDRLKARTLKRLRPAWDLYFDDPIRETFSPEKYAAFREETFVNYLRPRVLSMDWAEFRANRKHLVAFIKGEVGFIDLTKRIDPPKQTKRQKQKQKPPAGESAVEAAGFMVE